MKKLLILIIFILTGCETYHYYPTFQQIPKSTKAKEITGSYFSSDDNLGINVNYSITDNIGTFVTVNTFDSYDFKNGAHITDLGLYYSRSKKTSAIRPVHITYALSGGYGYGGYNRDADYYTLEINRAFLQPSFAYTSKFFDAGISSRFTYLDYTVKRAPANYSSTNLDDLRDMPSRGFVFFEPQFYFGIGYKGVKLNYHSVSLKKLNDAHVLFSDESIAYLSLSIKLNADVIFGSAK